MTGGNNIILIIGSFVFLVSELGGILILLPAVVAEVIIYTPL